MITASGMKAEETSFMGLVPARVGCLGIVHRVGWWIPGMFLPCRDPAESQVEMLGINRVCGGAVRSYAARAGLELACHLLSFQVSSWRTVSHTPRCVGP